MASPTNHTRKLTEQWDAYVGYGHQSGHQAGPCVPCPVPQNVCERRRRPSRIQQGPNVQPNPTHLLVEMYQMYHAHVSKEGKLSLRATGVACTRASHRACGANFWAWATSTTSWGCRLWKRA
eukprot:1177186-Prorocentrum_minimum.AAC.2